MKSQFWHLFTQGSAGILISLAVCIHTQINHGMVYGADIIAYLTGQYFAWSRMVKMINLIQK